MTRDESKSGRMSKMYIKVLLNYQESTAGDAAGWDCGVFKHSKFTQYGNIHHKICLLEASIVRCYERDMLVESKQVSVKCTNHKDGFGMQGLVKRLSNHFSMLRSIRFLLSLYAVWIWWRWCGNFCAVGQFKACELRFGVHCRWI
jgi:hypothetical protein